MQTDGAAPNEIKCYLDLQFLLETHIKGINGKEIYTAYLQLNQYLKKP
jgi:hypothetical protein